MTRSFSLVRTARRRLATGITLIELMVVLVIIGALNWGSVGLFSFDCVAFLFGGQTGAVSRIIYTLVGIAGLWCITLLFREDGTENT